jgi:hypothetical protein
MLNEASRKNSVRFDHDRRFAAAAVTVAPAHAQQTLGAPQNTAPMQAAGRGYARPGERRRRHLPESAEPSADDEVEAWSSRLAHPPRHLQLAVPIAVVGAEQIRSSGNVVLGDMLTDIPAITASASGQYTSTTLFLAGQAGSTCAPRRHPHPGADGRPPSRLRGRLLARRRLKHDPLDDGRPD